MTYMPNSSLYVRVLGQDSETDGRTHRHTDDAKTITPSADAGCNKCFFLHDAVMQKCLKFKIMAILVVSFGDIIWGRVYRITG